MLLLTPLCWHACMHNAPNLTQRKRKVWKLSIQYTSPWVNWGPWFRMARWTMKLAFCRWLTQTSLVIPTRTQHVSQREALDGSWLKLIVSAGFLTAWCAGATGRRFRGDSGNCGGFPKSRSAGVNISVLFLFNTDRIISCNLLSPGIIEWLRYWTASCRSGGLTNKVALMSDMSRVLKMRWCCFDPCHLVLAFQLLVDKSL